MTERSPKVNKTIAGIASIWQSDKLSDFRNRLVILVWIILFSAGGHVFGELVCRTNDYKHLLTAALPPLSGFCIFGLGIVRTNFIKHKEVASKIAKLKIWTNIQLLLIVIHLILILSLAVWSVCNFYNPLIFVGFMFFCEVISIAFIFMSLYTYNKALPK